MGAPYWTNEEEDYFEKVILPQSEYSTGTYTPKEGRDLAELAVVMQAELDRKGVSKRRYTGENLFQHWYQRHSQRAAERHQHAREQPLTKATTPGAHVSRTNRNTTPSSQSASPAPTRFSTRRQVDERVSSAMYTEQSTQTNVTIAPRADTEGGDEIRNGTSIHFLQSSHTSDNNDAIPPMADSSVLSTSDGQDNVVVQATQTPSKAPYQAYVEDADDEDDLSTLLKARMNAKKSSHDVSPAKTTKRSGDTQSPMTKVAEKARAPKTSSVSSSKSANTQDSSRIGTPHLSANGSNSNNKQKIIAPKRRPDLSPAPSSKRQKASGAASSFANTTTDHYQAQPFAGKSPVIAEPRLSKGDSTLKAQPANNKPQPLGYSAPPSSGRQQPNTRGLSMEQALMEVMRKKELERFSRAPSYSPLSSPGSRALQQSTLNTPFVEPEQGQGLRGRQESVFPQPRLQSPRNEVPFTHRRGESVFPEPRSRGSMNGNTPTIHREESVSSESRPHTPMNTGAFSRRGGQVPRIRSPPAPLPNSNQGDDGAGPQIFALENQYTFTESPAHSFYTPSPSQYSTPAGSRPGSSRFSHSGGTTQERPTSRRPEPSPLQMMSNSNDIGLSQKRIHSRNNSDGSSSVDSIESPTAGLGPRAAPPVPLFSTTSHESMSTRQPRSAPKRDSFAGNTTGLSTGDTHNSGPASFLDSTEASRGTPPSYRIPKRAPSQPPSNSKPGPTAMPTMGSFKAPPKPAGPRPEESSRTSTPEFDLFASSVPKAKATSWAKAPPKEEPKSKAKKDAERKASIAKGAAKIRARNGGV
ncbi:hypothetical protein EG329_003688 [Mollisiaceae sp. DMI_Dod_QoI]|nr:hypothetical protein EG329_003688 [Helotiales sp. DMI_Dod_QoI]